MLNVAVKSCGLPHVIVVGNEKGGSGKTTIAMHIAVALMKSGQRLATIDLDSRQRTLTHYIENRRAWARRCHVDLELPTHLTVAYAEGARVDENEAAEFADFGKAVAAIEHRHDFVVIDTPPHDSYLMRLAHSVTDTLVTPLNDSFVDFAVLGTVDPTTYAVTGESHYAKMVREARQQRRVADGVQMDWVVVRNRLSILDSRNKQRIVEGLGELATRLGFRSADALAERVVYRELFPRGLTALDELNEKTLGARPNLAHLTARHEILNFIEKLRLPLDERAQRRAAAQAEWLATRDQPLEVHDVIAE